MSVCLGSSCPQVEEQKCRSTERTEKLKLKPVRMPWLGSSECFLMKNCYLMGLPLGFRIERRLSEGNIVSFRRC